MTTRTHQVHSAVVHGFQATLCRVTATLAEGLPGIEVTGLPEVSARELRLRIREALGKAGVRMRTKVLVHVHAGLRAAGAVRALDLPAAVAVAVVQGAVPPASTDGALLLGELALDGMLRPVCGLVPSLWASAKADLCRAIVPAGSVAEAALVPGIDAHPAKSLAEVLAFLRGDVCLTTDHSAAEATRHSRGCAADLAEIPGHATAKRALEIAAVGRLHLLLQGPPGCGATMLARRLPGLLPALTPGQGLEVAAIQSASGLPLPSSLHEVQRPFRAPHHSASTAALVGSHGIGRLGEATLAHEGVLFLDQVQEFSRLTREHAGDVMRRQHVQVRVEGASLLWPARVQVVASAPRLSGDERPWGWVAALREFLARHFALVVDLHGFDEERGGDREEESSATVQGRVTTATAFAESLPANLASATGTHQERVARAIANLEQSPEVRTRHVEEAATFVGGRGRAEADGSLTARQH